MLNAKFPGLRILGGCTSKKRRTEGSLAAWGNRKSDHGADDIGKHECGINCPVDERSRENSQEKSSSNAYIYCHLDGRGGDDWSRVCRFVDVHFFDDNQVVIHRDDNIHQPHNQEGVELLFHGCHEKIKFSNKAGQGGYPCQRKQK